MLSNLSLLIAVLIPLHAASAQVLETNCGKLDEAIVVNNLPCIVNEAIDRSFPGLALAKTQGRIKIGVIDSQSVFTQASLDHGYLRSSKKRIYSIEINPTVYRTFLPSLPRPTVEAVIGAVARELVHIQDFENASGVGLTGLLKQAWLNKASYEHAADDCAFELGYARAIQKFRIWSLDRLDPKDRAQQNERYYTPEQIQDWIMTNEWARPKH